MEWISVKERLPEHNQYVLMYGEGDRQFTARFMYGQFLAYNPFVEGLEDCEAVTHWMPLPEPPKP